MAMAIAKILVCFTTFIIQSTQSTAIWHTLNVPSSTTTWLTKIWPSTSWLTTRTTTAWSTTWSTTTWPTTSWSTPTWPTTTWLTTKWLTTIRPTTTWLTNGPTTTQTKTTWPTTTETTHTWLTTTWPRTTGLTTIWPTTTAFTTTWLTTLWPTTTEPTTTETTSARSQSAATSKPSSDKESDVAKIVAPIVSVCVVLVVVVVVVFLIVRRKKMKLGNDLEGRYIQDPIYQNRSGEPPSNPPTEMNVYEYAEYNVHNDHILQAVQETRKPRTDNIYDNLSRNHTQASLGQNMLIDNQGPSNYADLAQGKTGNKPVDAAVGYLKLGEVMRTGDGPDFSDYTSLEKVDGVYMKLGEPSDPNVYETLKQ